MLTEVKVDMGGRELVATVTMVGSSRLPSPVLVVEYFKR